MKKLISIILTAALILGMFALPVSASSKWDGWTAISTAEDLLKMEGSSGKFYLTKDIDLKNYKPKGTRSTVYVQWEPINSFSGTLDGNGFAIKNMSRLDTQTIYGGGLFTVLRGNVVIKNLGFVNVNLKAEQYMGLAKHLSALAYHVNLDAGSVLIENVYVTGKIQNTGAYGGVAGIVYQTQQRKDGNTLTFKNCTNRADITSNYYAAGIITHAAGAELINCVNGGKITGNTNTGIVGAIAGATGSVSDITKMTSCYNYGTVVNNDAKYEGGGLVGTTYGNSIELKDCATISSNFYATGLTSSLITAKTNVSKSALKKADTYKDFDFKNIWYADAKINNGYPILQTMLKNYSATKPVSSHEAGTYKKGTSITLSTELKNVTIYYTTDGKTPTTSSQKYTGAITLNADTTVRAAVYTEGKTRGQLVKLDFKVN